jgi:hypothetical protein
VARASLPHRGAAHGRIKKYLDAVGEIRAGPGFDVKRITWEEAEEVGCPFE